MKVFSFLSVVLSTIMAFGANNELKSLVLDSSTGTAVATASCGTFLDNGNFLSEQFPSTIISIIGEDSLFDGLSRKETVSISGSYHRSDRGVAPKIIIYADKLHRQEDQTVPLGDASVNSGLAPYVTRVAEDWRDSNISTGTTVLAYMKLPGGEEINKEFANLFKQEIVREGFSEHLARVNASITERPLNEVTFRTLVSTLMASNACDPKFENAKQRFTEDLNNILAMFGTRNEIKVIRLSAKLPDDPKNLDAFSSNKLDFFALVNPATRELVYIYTREGTM